MPIFRVKSVKNATFCVKSVKIYIGQKNLHGYTRGARDKYEVWSEISWFTFWGNAVAEVSMDSLIRIENDWDSK